MCRAKADKKLTFTNSDNVDLDILYVDLERDEDNVKLEQEDVRPAGVDDLDKEDDPQDDPDIQTTTVVMMIQMTMMAMKEI